MYKILHLILSEFISLLNRALLPQYRPAPDYDTALVQKYGPSVDPAAVRATVLYSSQPEISTKAHISENPSEGKCMINT